MVEIIPALQSSVLDGANEDGWRSAEIKATINIGKISSFGHKIFFSLWSDGSSKKFTLRK